MNALANNTESFQLHAVQRTARRRRFVLAHAPVTVYVNAFMQAVNAFMQAVNAGSQRGVHADCQRVHASRVNSHCSHARQNVIVSYYVEHYGIRSGVEQKADVVLLKQELDYWTTGCLLHIYVCTGDCMALSIRSEVAFEKLLAWRVQ